MKTITSDQGVEIIQEIFNFIVEDDELLANIAERAEISPETFQRWMEKVKYDISDVS